MNPVLTVNLDKLTDNAREIVKLCRPHGISVSAVTKGFCAKPKVAAAILKGGIESLADARIENLRRLRKLEAEKIMLRLPMPSEADAVVRYAHISLNSQFNTLKALDCSAGKLNMKHGVILMFDLGDLREGVFDSEELFSLAGKTSRLRNLRLKGIGTNLTCLGAILPDEENLGRLVDLAREVSEAIGEDLDMISGGNSSSLYLLQNGKMPPGINHLRIGEAILCGTESAYFTRLPGMHYDCFQLIAEVVEVFEKPSLPIGTAGKDAFRQRPCFVDRGRRKRAIAAIGKQDLASHPVFPLDRGVEVLGSSSDHLILDIADAARNIRTGDEVIFNLSYGAIMALSTSPYVKKDLIS